MVNQFQERQTEFPFAAPVKLEHKPAPSHKGFAFTYVTGRLRILRSIPSLEAIAGIDTIHRMVVGFAPRKWPAFLVSAQILRIDQIDHVGTSL